MRWWILRIFDMICFVFAPAWTGYHLLDVYIRGEYYGYPYLNETRLYVGLCNNDTRLYVALGISLICLGFVLKQWQRSNLERKKP